MGFLHLADDGVHRAVAGAERAALTLGGVDLVLEQAGAGTGGAALFVDVGFVFRAEEAHTPRQHFR